MASIKSIAVKVSLCAAICASAGPAASAAEFDLVVFPWVMEGTPTEFVGKNKEALEKGREQLAASLGEKQTLAEIYEKSEVVVKNIHKEAKKFHAVKLKDQKKGYILIQPKICRLQNKLIFGVDIHRLDRWSLVASSHKVLENIESELKEEDVYNLLNSAYVESAEKIKSPDSRNNLKVKFTNAKGSKIRLGSESWCLTNLYEEKLSSKFKVITSSGYENYSLFKRTKLVPENSPARATRQLIIDWYNEGESNYSYRIWKAESVFGQRIKGEINAKFTLKLSNNKFSFEDDLDLIKYLQEEKEALVIEEMPQISKIYRAWAYVDKGRAWGLKIGDRLYTRSNDGELIKGHVVGFFGPDHKIKSPRGYMVNEGAIVYIRKGQRLTRLGQEFTWDPRTFPTPWPPKIENTTN